MALTIGDNFSYMGAKPLDARLKYDTLAAMKAMADSTLYDGCLAYCAATDKTYQWKSTNTVDADLGKWREFTSGGSGSDNVIEGYRNPADSLFYEENTFTTAITGAANTLYIDLLTDDIYRWNGTAFILENTRSKEISKADFDALPQSDKDNGTVYYIPDATVTSGMMVVGNRFDKANIYTATERMIGSYMGKPLYQRTVDCGSLLNAGQLNAPHNIANVDKIWVKDGLATSSDGVTQITIPQVNPQYLDRSVHCSADRNYIFIITGSDRTNLTGYVTVQYTKTTDGQISIGTPNDYSTDEVIVGTWIDEKPLYQKTIFISALTGDTVWYNHGIENLKSIINIFGFSEDHYEGSVKGLVMPRVAFDGNNIGIQHYNSTQLEIGSKLSYSRVRNIYFTLQYTKTTD